MEQAAELKDIQKKLITAFEILYAVENALPEASADFEMALDEGYEMVREAVKGIDDLIVVIEGILKEMENVKG